MLRARELIPCALRSVQLILVLLGLQVRVLLFMITITVGIVEGLTECEQSIPVALGYEAKDPTRHDILSHSEPFPPANDM